MAAEDVILLIDEVVAKQHGKRLMADMPPGAEHGMAQPQRVSLAHVVNVGQGTGRADGGQLRMVALALQALFKGRLAVEVVFQRPLVPPGDHDDVRQPGTDGFFHHILDGGFVDERGAFPWAWPWWRGGTGFPARRRV